MKSIKTMKVRRAVGYARKESRLIPSMLVRYAAGIPCTPSADGADRRRNGGCLQFGEEGVKNILSGAGYKFVGNGHGADKWMGGNWKKASAGLSKTRYWRRQKIDKDRRESGYVAAWWHTEADFGVAHGVAGAVYVFPK